MDGSNVEKLVIRRDAEPETNTLQVRYQTHIQGIGWQDYVKNGEMSGTTGQSKRLEGINIQLVPKGGAAPGSTAKPNVVGGGGKLPENPYKE